MLIHLVDDLLRKERLRIGGVNLFSNFLYIVSLAFAHAKFDGIQRNAADIQLRVDRYVSCEKSLGDEWEVRRWVGMVGFKKRVDHRWVIGIVINESCQGVKYATNVVAPEFLTPNPEAGVGQRLVVVPGLL